MIYCNMVKFVIIVSVLGKKQVHGMNPLYSDVSFIHCPVFCTVGFGSALHKCHVCVSQGPVRRSVFIVLRVTCSRNGSVCRSVLLDTTLERQQDSLIRCATGYLFIFKCFGGRCDSGDSWKVGGSISCLAIHVLERPWTRQRTPRGIWRIQLLLHRLSRRINQCRLWRQRALSKYIWMNICVDGWMRLAVKRDITTNYNFYCKYRNFTVAAIHTSGLHIWHRIKRKHQSQFLGN